MALQDDVREESIIMRWFTFERKPSLLDEGYGMVIIRIGLLLFAALLFRLILAETQLNPFWAVIALVFSLLASFLLMLLLENLTKIYGSARLFIFGAGMAVLFVIVMALSML